MKQSIEKEITKKNYTKAIQLYSEALAKPDLATRELSELFYGRSICYVKVYESSNMCDDSNLYRALLDAENVCSREPSWSVGYKRTAEIYQKLGNLNKARKFYEKALALDVKNEDLKNSLAIVKMKSGEQIRLEHLFDDNIIHTKSVQEKNELLAKQLTEVGMTLPPGFDISQAEERHKKDLEAKDPSYKDVHLGHAYQYGLKKTKKNLEMAAIHYGKAAQKDNAEACYNLALLHMKGLGVRVDFKTAVSLLKRAAEQPPFIKKSLIDMPNIGVADSELWLGLAYASGIYVEENRQTAIYWYERAIKHKNGTAAANLGIRMNNYFSIFKK